MHSIAKTIEAQLNVARQSIAKNMIAQNRKASGNSINLMRVEANDNGGVLIDGAGYLFASEYGRRPNQKQPGRPGKAFVDSIEKWTYLKGIVAKNGNQRSLAFAIATKIAKEGNVLYRSGKNSGVITEAINQQWLSDTARLIGEEFATLIKETIVRNSTVTTV